MLYSDGNNIASDDTCSLDKPSDMPSTPDPGLGPWKDSDGVFWLTLPLAGGPAHDHGDCGMISTEQRGVSRPQGAACDIGAIERGPADKEWFSICRL